MTLEEAIKHCEEVAKEQGKLCKRYDDASGYSRSHNEAIRTTDAKRCEECAEEHRQLAEWLKELKDYRERMPSYEAGYNDAKREIALSGEYERCYERGKADTQTEKWIPVSERLPSEDGCYLVSTTGTNNDIIDIAYYTKEIWHKASRIKAWMPLPSSYQGEENG